MAMRNEASEALPASHFFITVARGQASRTFAARCSVAFTATALVPLLLLWFLGSTFFLVFHDDLVTALMLHERDLQYSYEDRIAALRSQLDREATRQLVVERSVKTKLDELATREAELQTRSGVIAQLNGQADHMVGFAGPGTAGPVSDGIAAVETPSLWGAARTPHDRDLPAKPHPEAAVLPPSSPEGSTSRTSASLAERVSSLLGGLDLIANAQDTQVASLDSRVRKTVGRYRDALATAGLTEERLAAHRPAASGGPFVPLTREDDGSPFARAAVVSRLAKMSAQRR